MNSQFDAQDYLAKKEHCKKIIMQAVKIKDSGSCFPKESAWDVMTGSIQEELYNLLHSEDGYNDWGSEMYHVKSILTGILVLLAKPGVLSQLPEALQEDAAEKIKKLVDLFDTINNDKVHAFMDIALLNYCEEDETNNLTKYYGHRDQDFNKEPYHNYIFDEWVTNKRRFERMGEFIKSQTI